MKQCIESLSLCALMKTKPPSTKLAPKCMAVVAGSLTTSTFNTRISRPEWRRRGYGQCRRRRRARVSSPSESATTLLVLEGRQMTHRNIASLASAVAGTAFRTRPPRTSGTSLVELPRRRSTCAGAAPRERPHSSQNRGCWLLLHRSQRRGVARLDAAPGRLPSKLGQRWPRRPCLSLLWKI